MFIVQAAEAAVCLLKLSQRIQKRAGTASLKSVTIPGASGFIGVREDEIPRLPEIFDRKRFHCHFFR